MTQLKENLLLLDNIVVWFILLMAFLCYGLLIDLCFLTKTSTNWYQRSTFWVPSIKHLLAALPLLGLLGTIGGLLQTFTRIAKEKSFSTQELMSGGIADAMFTTQLGLIMLIPGLLMLALLAYKKEKWTLQVTHEIKN